MIKTKIIKMTDLHIHLLGFNQEQLLDPNSDKSILCDNRDNMLI